MGTAPARTVGQGLPGVWMGGSRENGRRHGRLSLLGLREVAVLFLCELEAASALELSSVPRGHVLVAFQEERELRDVLVSLSAVRAAGLVSKNSQYCRLHVPSHCGLRS